MINMFENSLCGWCICLDMISRIPRSVDLNLGTTPILKLFQLPHLCCDYLIYCYHLSGSVTLIVTCISSIIPLEVGVAVVYALESINTEYQFLVTNLPPTPWRTNPNPMTNLPDSGASSSQKSFCHSKFMRHNFIYYIGFCAQRYAP